MSIKKTCNKLIIQIPAWNEEDTIEAILRDIPTSIDGVDRITIVVIDDCSKDNTPKIARGFGIKNVISLSRHCGLGYVFRVGLENALRVDGDIIINTDADGAFFGEEITKIIRPILENKADVVIGDRQLVTLPGYPRWKLFLQYVGNTLISYLFHYKVNDVASGFRAFTRDCAEILVKELRNDYTYTLESLCVLMEKKKRICFVPIKIRYPTRASRLIKSKILYIMNFLSTLINKRLFYCSNPNTREHWNRKLSRYDTFWRNENYYHILDLFPKNEPFSLLDVGCAIGDGCVLLQKNFPKAKITGIDMSEVGIEKAKKKSKTIQYFVEDILKDSIPGTYDYIAIIQTLEHFDNPFFVIDKCLAHTRKSIIISTPYWPAFIGKILCIGEHRYSFNKKTLAGYNHRVVKITGLVKVSKSRCIIYEVFPEKTSNLIT